MAEHPPEAPLPAAVPVALFVHRRHDLLDRTLDCLRAAGVRCLHVFSDGPRDVAEEAAVQRVRERVAAIDWTEPVTVARPRNLGLNDNIRSGLDALFERHPAAIVIEDDICVAPEFYEYACAALGHYRHEPLVAGITGLRLPFRTRALDAYPFDVFMSPRFAAWGWATWRDRWQSFSFDHERLRVAIARADRFRPARGGYDLPRMIHEALYAQTLEGSWDVVCNTNMLLRGQYFVTPRWNMVENTGFADGTHFGGADPWGLVWERDRQPTGTLRFAPVEESRAILRDYRRIHRPTRIRMVRNRVGPAVVKLAGPLAGGRAG